MAGNESKAWAPIQPLPHWERRVRWFLAEKALGREPTGRQLPWHWTNEIKGTMLCAACSVPSIGSIGPIGWCRAHEDLVRKELS